MIYTKAEAQAKYPNTHFPGTTFNIGHNVRIGDNVTIWDNITIGHNVRIGDNVIIWDNITIGDNVTIEDNVDIRPSAIIRNGSTIAYSAIIPFGSEVPNSRTNVKRALVINGVGEHKQMTAIDCDDGLIIGIGCMNDYKGLPIDEAKKEIAKKYPDENHLYYSVLRLAQEWYEERQQ